MDVKMIGEGRKKLPVLQRVTTLKNVILYQSVFDAVSKDFIRWILKYEIIDAILPLIGRQLSVFGTVQHKQNCRSQLSISQTAYFETCLFNNAVHR
jgi:hypothetical protein